MTVENTNNTISYTGNGSVTTFAYNFLTYSADHIFIYFDDVLQSSGFTITGVGDDNGGDIIFVSPPDTGVTIRIDRTVPDTQLLEYQEYGPFPAKANERGLDLLTMAVQQNARELSRTSQELDQNKMDKQPLATKDNIIVFDDAGNSKDSGINSNDIRTINDDITNISNQLAGKVNRAGDLMGGQLKGPNSTTVKSYMPQLQIMQAIERALKPFNPSDNTAEDYGFIYQSITSTADYGSIS